MATHNKITQQEIDLICSQKYTFNELVFLLDRHRETIRRLHHQFNIPLNNPIHERNIYKYKINHHYFKILNRNNAYFLGFISADGSVELRPRNSGVLSIALNIKDEDILCRFKNDIATEAPIKYKISNFNTKIAKIDICSKTIVDDLISLGITPRKSLTLKFPQISSEFYADFIRGYIDGDGCFRFTNKNNNKRLILEILGTKDFLDAIQNIFHTILKITNRNIIQQNNYYILNYYHNDALLIGNWLYNGTNLFLERKYLLWKEAWYKIGFTRKNK